MTKFSSKQIGGRYMMREICDIKYVSNYLQVSVPEVRKLVRMNEIPFFRVGNRLNFDINNINKWIEKLEEKEQQNSLFY